jgi:hypothetical protein
MAISVDTVYKTVLSILNKEARGFMTPSEFDRIGTQVQLDILDNAFYIMIKPPYSGLTTIR